MTKEEKSTLIESLKKDFSDSKFIAVANFKGVTVEKITRFRASVRKSNASYRVAKNTILSIAAKSTEFESFVKDLKGPNGVVFSYSDPVAVAKAIDTFSKEEEKFEVKKVVFAGKELTKAELTALSSLPSKEVLLSQLLSVMNGPIRNFACVLAAVPRSFVTVLDAIAKNKEKNN